jgi:phage tail-like protein
MRASPGRSSARFPRRIRQRPERALVSPRRGVAAPGRGRFVNRIVIASLMLIAIVLGTGASDSQARTANLRGSDVLIAVEFEGLPTMGFFQSVSGLTFETTVVEYRDGGSPGFTRKLIGVTKWPNLVLKQGFTGDITVLHLWAARVAAGATERRNGTIVLYDKSQQPLVRYHIENAWPSKFEISGLDTESNAIAIETIEIAHDGLSHRP